MEKVINMDGHEIPLKATAATPIHYRNMFGRDMMRDMQTLMEGKDEATGEYSITTLEVFEKIAYIMARSGTNNSPDFPKSPTEWLDQFSMFTVYDVLPEIIDLWGMNTKTLEESKKKLSR